MQASVLLRASAFVLLLLPRPTAAEPIDRPALVARHTVHVHSLDPQNPLTVGNGDFAFTADVTGLQSFESLYHARNAQYLGLARISQLRRAPAAGHHEAL